MAHVPLAHLAFIFKHVQQCNLTHLSGTCETKTQTKPPVWGSSTQRSESREGLECGLRLPHHTKKESLREHSLFRLERTQLKEDLTHTNISLDDEEKMEEPS